MTDTKASAAFHPYATREEALEAEVRALRANATTSSASSHKPADAPRTPCEPHADSPPDLRAGRSRKTSPVAAPQQQHDQEPDRTDQPAPHRIAPDGPERSRTGRDTRTAVTGRQEGTET